MAGGVLQSSSLFLSINGVIFLLAVTATSLVDVNRPKPLFSHKRLSKRYEVVSASSPSSYTFNFDSSIGAARSPHRNNQLIIDSCINANARSYNRRTFVSLLVATATFSVNPMLAAPALSSPGDDSSIFTRAGKDYGYSFLPPPEFKPSNKPLKTHLDEINFSVEGVRGYQYGVTVDPVRIDSLKQFGTPEQVAARVVGTEIKRDGVTDVTLYGDAFEDPENGMYAINYISAGSRGIKHFVTRIAIKQNKLYVLTAQVKETEYKEREKEILSTVNTFCIT